MHSNSLHLPAEPTKCLQIGFRHPNSTQTAMQKALELTTKASLERKMAL
jgi:hypothetical protein